MEAGLVQREGSDYGGSFRYGTNDYPCSMGTTGFGARLVSGGFSPHSEVTITVRKSVIPDAQFKSSQPMTVTDKQNQSRRLMIAEEGIRDCIYAWELTLKDPNTNA